MFVRWVFACIIVLLGTPGALLAQDDEKERDQQVLRDAGVTWDGPALLGYFQKRSLTEEQRRSILTLIRESGSESFKVRQAATARLQAIGVAAIGPLKQAQRDPDPEISRRATLCLAQLEKVPSNLLTSAVARMLGRVKPPGALDVLLAHLPLAEDEFAADGMRWSIGQLALRDGKPDPLLVDALKDKLGVRRSAAGEALLRAGVDSLKPQLRQLLRDPDAEVRVRLALALVTVAKEKAAVPDLIALLPDVPIHLGWQAEELLCQLAGDDGPKVSLVGDADARRRCRDAWSEWWTRHEKTVDLAKLNERPRMLGYTLVVQMNANGTGGKVLELATDGKTVRWQVDGLLLPISAQVLPGSQRVLVAEHNAHMVAERDFQGGVHWKHALSEPLYGQRLPNGNTFMASRSQLLEVDAKGNTVFTLQRPAHDIVAARRSRDGQYVIATSQRRVIRIDNKGQEVRSFAVPLALNYFSGMQLLANNRVLLTHPGSVAEYDEVTGKQVWTGTVARNPTSVFRLPNGNTLVACTAGRRIQELDRNGKIVDDQAITEATPWFVQRR